MYAAESTTPEQGQGDYPEDHECMTLVLSGHRHMTEQQRP